MGLAVLGAAFIWIGGSVVLRPTEVAQRFRRAFGNRHTAFPEYIRADPKSSKPIIRIQGAVMILIGFAMMALAAYLYRASRV